MTKELESVFVLASVLIFIGGIVVGILSVKCKPEVIELINPQCYKTTTKGTDIMLHRIKCPTKESL